MPDPASSAHRDVSGKLVVDKAETPPGHAGREALSTILEHAGDLLISNPAKAEKTARDILKSLPGQQHALTLLVASRRAMGDLGGARAVLETSAKSQPKIAAAQYELGLLLGELGDYERAIATLLRVVDLEPNHPSVWRVLGDMFAQVGRTVEAADAYGKQFASSVNDIRMLEDAVAHADGQIEIAESMLRQFLSIYATDVSALHMLARLGIRLGRRGDAEKLLARALEIAPQFAAARREYAILALEQYPAEGKRQVDILLEREPRSLDYRALRAVALFCVGEYRQAIDCCEDVIRDDSTRPKIWLTYGHALKTVGRTAEAVVAYRRSLALEPGLGEAWWSLANLKTFRFVPADVEAMLAGLARDNLSGEDRQHLHFALGKALEDRAAFVASFEHYRRGNALRHMQLNYNADEMSDFVRRSKALFTREFFRARGGLGCRAGDPIFIVGLPRSGSTLIEQILASHPAIEGTMELPDIGDIAMRLSDRAAQNNEGRYPELLGRLGGAELKSLGEEYIARTAIQRKLDRPLFTDKMPNNFHHLGFILSILPNAKIIDMRRHPLGCCLANFKQHFSSGVPASYDLSDIGRYYRDYVDLMAHFDKVLPGRIHRVVYEELVRDPDKEIRRLLDYCGLPFEEACLRFYGTDRGVRTASSEQVRLPIYSDAIEHWRNYEQWLGPLKIALGPVLDAYPAVPAFS